jgi:hypothetical protein
MIAIEVHLADTERNRVDPLELSQDSPEVASPGRAVFPCIL